MEGVKVYTLFGQGTIEGIPGVFSGNTVVYVDEVSREVLQVSPIGTPFAGREQAPPQTQEQEQGASLPDVPAQDTSAGNVRMGG